MMFDVEFNIYSSPLSDDVQVTIIIIISNEIM